MAIASLDAFAASRKENVYYLFSTRAALGAWMSSWNSASATIPVTTTGVYAVQTSGQVPTDATAGALPIFNFTGEGYITGCELANTSIGPNGASPGWYKAWFVDRLFHCGSYSGAASTTNLSAQPSYASRLPDSVYDGTQIWIEYSDASGGSAVNITVTYTNEAGTPGRSTGAFSFTGNGRSDAAQMPLQSGDKGVSKIESVTWAATMGNFNIVVARPLFRWTLMGGTGAGGGGTVIGLGNFPSRRGIIQIPMSRIYNDCAFQAFFAGNSSNAVSTIEASVELAVN